MNTEELARQFWNDLRERTPSFMHEWDRSGPAAKARFIKAFAKVRQEAFREAIPIVCAMCKDGMGVLERGGGIFHNRGGALIRCKAEELRRKAGEG